VRLADPERPEAGLFFDGRVSEDFKLTSGTWVSVGELRIEGISALAPIAQDIVVTGHDRDEVGFLVFPNIPACRRIAGAGNDTPLPEVLNDEAVRADLREGLLRLKEKSGGGTSRYATRARLLAAPPSADAGEITDKGYINQRAVLACRAAEVALLQGDNSAHYVGIG
jgi:feruloyl-CoA synthase